VRGTVFANWAAVLVDFSSASVSSTRRHEPRFAVDGRLSILCIDAVSIDVLAVVDLSFGGFSIETNERIAPGVRHIFEIRSRGGLVVTAPARACYCRQGARRGTFRSGWEFVPLRDLDHDVERVLDAMPGLRAS
jgi:hypothetical protein